MVDTTSPTAAELQDHLDAQPGLNVLIAAVYATLPIYENEFAERYIQDHPLQDSASADAWLLDYNRLWTKRLRDHVRALVTMINYTQFAAGDKVPSFRVEVSESRNPDHEFEILIEIFGERACGLLWRNGQWSGHS